MLSANKKNTVRQSTALGLAVTIAAIVISGAQAHADSTFLLQFGSYVTQDQATQKWEDIKSKNADVVGKLNLHVAEVALPPDNTIMYRTQAGPLASRAQAVSLCGTLKTRDVDCFVVETALFTAEPSITQAQNDLPTLPPLTVTSPIPEEAPAAVPSKPVAPTAASLPVPPAPPALTASGTPQTAVPATASTSTNKPGFFSRLFGTSSTPTPAAAVTAPIKTTAVAAPVASVTSAPVTYSSNYNPPIIPAPAGNPSMTGGNESVPFPVPSAPLAAKPAVTSPAEPVFVPAPTTATLTASSSNTISAQPIMDTPSSSSVASAPPPSHTASNWVVPGREPKNLNQESGPGAATVPVAASPAGSSDVVGDVKVAEAIRVPLGSGAKPKKVVILPPVHGLGGTPSATTHKTYWAQLSYFADEGQARGFYDKFHADYPQFSDGVRVRITHPYTSSAGRVSLRVGPFIGTDDVHTICKAASERGVSCTIVKEVGTSSSATPLREHTLYHSNAESVSAASEISSANDSHHFWLQLGTFHSSDDAWDNWKDLQDENKRLLRKAHADVSAPSMSSAQRAVYRLRVGPYTSESSAEDLCDKLEDAGVSCIVVNDR